ncbi:uncharacterized protein LOC127095092 [Lathyrus oleraceus]|uniref:uncharacterized protein LOC127095092 n=1 Tax=Pisum sativum TaxID=3888 RepID=UPI0021D2ABBD|nr:uncharacterized protein LOC127095092 [Pisum sativum]
MRVKAIEEKLKAMGNTNVLGLYVEEMCLVPRVIIPAKFKVSDFEKYKGNSDPRTHIRAYCRKMVAYSDDDQLLMHFFQYSLSGASLDWYLQLEGSHIHTWREMVEAFLKHYQYNTDMAPNLTQFQNLTLRFEESFKEYAQQWRELAARVQPPLLERELVDMIMGNLQGPYLDRMVGRTSSGFSDLVIAGERIENMIKMGKIQNSTSTSSASKKPFVPYNKKREGETNATSIIRTRNASYPQVTATVPVQPSQQQPFTILVQTQQHQRYQQPQQQRELGPSPAVLPPSYDANAHCEFHSSASGHSIDNCKVLKYKVQDLIYSKEIVFSPKGANVSNNPMPPHNNAVVNMMEAGNGRRLMSCVDELKTPLIEIKNALMRDNAFPICSNDCEHCLINLQQCRTLKSVRQQLMDQGILVVDYPSTKEDVSTLEIPYDDVPPLQIPYDFSQLTLLTNPVTPIIITIPTPFPYVDTKEVPWMYETSVYIHGQKIQEEPLKSSDPMINITGTGGITRSGKIFALTSTLIGTINPSTSDKGKQIDGA